ncbi:hypothetical protein [Hydrogenophaga sp.]|uniref:hypothetical protein n=1 Tax=Hydrogenophaga sp. TaxID=1904254 RepID=UPI00271855DE|nr:hypothetical protein [Hydrogenophaga sp.]MDO9434944.1 hypothetical protein [Hydrogenophaga sp.]
MIKDKQLALKPFDFVLAVKIAVTKDQDFLIAQLADEFAVSLSTVHAALGRSEAARLLTRSAGSIRALRPALQEFAIHGLKYAFPAAVGRATRGMPTAIGAPVLAAHFEATGAPVPVWSHPEGTTYGFEVIPLHPSVPKVALKDQALYDVLALVDALRVGAAREREIALNELKARL